MYVYMYIATERGRERERQRARVHTVPWCTIWGCVSPMPVQLKSSSPGSSSVQGHALARTVSRSIAL